MTCWPFVMRNDNVDPKYMIDPAAAGFDSTLESNVGLRMR